MGNLRLFNDERNIVGTNFKETVKVERSIHSDQTVKFRGIPNGVNRINIFCEEEGLYDVRVWQFLETLTMTADSTGESAYLPSGALNLNAPIMCYDAAVVLSADSVLTPELYVAPATSVRTGFIKTSTGTTICYDTGWTASKSVHNFLYYPFTTGKLAATLPLVPMYNTALASYTEERCIQVDFQGIGDTPVTVQLTEEDARTAVVS